MKTNKIVAVTIGAVLLFLVISVMIVSILLLNIRMHLLTTWDNDYFLYEDYLEYEGEEYYPLTTDVYKNIDEFYLDDETELYVKAVKNEKIIDIVLAHPVPFASCLYQNKDIKLIFVPSISEYYICGIEIN